MKFSYPPHFAHDNEPAMWQNPYEFRMTVKLMRALKTESVLEIGAGYGYFRKWLENIGINVYSIDIEPKFIAPDESLFKGDSQSTKAFEWAFEKSPLGGYDVVYIDGAHDYMGCLSDYNTYSKLIRKAIMVHDIDSNQSGKYPVDFGPSEVWNEIICTAHRTIEISDKYPFNCGVGIALL